MSLSLHTFSAKRVKEENEKRAMTKTKVWKSPEEEQAFINRMLDTEKQKQKRLEQLREKKFEQNTFKPKTNNYELEREGDACEKLYQQGFEIQKRKEIIKEQYEQYLESIRSTRFITKGNDKYLEEMKEKRLFSLFNLFCIESDIPDKVDIGRLHENILPLLDKFGEPLALVVPLLEHKFGDAVINYEQFKLFICSEECNINTEDLGAQVKLLTLQMAVESNHVFAPQINEASRRMDPFAKLTDDRVDAMLAYKECKELKIEMMKDKQAQREMDMCTFRPSINKHH